MASTQNPQLLPYCKELKAICKAISVLDAILSPEWEFRYYSYSSEWGEGEECLQMHNGHGDDMHILFTEAGCAINGFAHEYTQEDKARLTSGLPEAFHEFIFGEPVASGGTTFCLWNEGVEWKTGDLTNFEDNSAAMLSIFNGGPQSYIDYATEYFEGSYKDNGLSLDTIATIYAGEVLTKEMVLTIVDSVDDWKKLENDLVEIGYPFDFPETGRKSKWKFW